MSPSTKKALLIGGIAVALAGAIAGTAYAVTHITSTQQLSQSNPSAQFVPGHRYTMTVTGAGAGLTMPQGGVAQLQADLDQEFGQGIVKVQSASVSQAAGGTITVVFDYTGAAAQTLTIPPQIWSFVPSTIQVTVTDNGPTPAS